MGIAGLGKRRKLREAGHRVPRPGALRIDAADLAVMSSIFSSQAVALFIGLHVKDGKGSDVFMDHPPFP